MPVVVNPEARVRPTAVRFAAKVVGLKGEIPKLVCEFTSQAAKVITEDAGAIPKVRLFVPTPAALLA
jgi:hypothetical protein